MRVKLLVAMVAGMLVLGAFVAYEAVQAQMTAGKNASATTDDTQHIEKLVRDFLNGMQIGIKLTHEDIASLIGSTRETTSKILNEFKSHGWIDVVKRQIILIDQKVLAEMK